jgi:hypothetical protein
MNNTSRITETQLCTQNASGASCVFVLLLCLGRGPLVVNFETHCTKAYTCALKIIVIVMYISRRLVQS